MQNARVGNPLRTGEMRLRDAARQLTVVLRQIRFADGRRTGQRQKRWGLSSLERGQGSSGTCCWPGNPDLVDEVANVCKDRVAQIHTKQARAEWSAQALLEALEDGGREISLLAQQFQQRSAIGWILVVAGQPACRTNGQGKGDRSCA
jgi:hypothetical protein